MQGTVVLGTGEPSPIMKRSPSARLDKKEAFANGDKLFQSFDGAIGRTRRNSIPSPFGLRNETSRGSVPLLLGVPGHRPNSGTTRSSLSNLNGSKRSWKSYLMKGLGDQTGGSGGGGNSDLSKLDDKLATIKHQLGDMSIETRNFGARVSSLVQDITTLSQTIPRPCSAYGNNSSTNSSHDKILTLPQNKPQRAETTTSSAGKPQYNTLPLVLPMTRAHSQPTHLLDEWRIEFKSTSHQGEECSESQDEESAGDVSQESQEDFEVRVIHSSLLDNHHHMIVVSSPCPSNDPQSSSDENLHDIFGTNAKVEAVKPATQFPLLTDMEDVFDI